MCTTVPIIAEFFLFLFSDKKLLPQTIEGYRSALSMKLDADLELGSNKELRRLIQSFYKSRPKASRHLPSWDLTLVLQALTGAPFEPLSHAEPKFLTWKTVFLIALASGRRRSKIHTFTFKGCSHSKGWSKVILKSDPAFLAKNQLASEGPSIFSEIEIPALTNCLGQEDKRTGLYVLLGPLDIICLGLLTLDREGLFSLSLFSSLNRVTSWPRRFLIVLKT